MFIQNKIPKQNMGNNQNTQKIQKQITKDGKLTKLKTHHNNG